MEFPPPGFPSDLPTSPDAPASFGPYLGPGKGNGGPAPYALGPPAAGYPMGGGKGGDSNSLQHGSGADASQATASDDVAEGRSPKRRFGESGEERPRDPSPGASPAPPNSMRPPPRQYRNGPSVEELTAFWNWFQGQKGGGVRFEEHRGRAEHRTVLDERYFRHMQDNKFKGNTTDYRTFVTDLLVAIGRLDGRLAKNLKHMLSSRKVESASVGISEKQWDVIVQGGVEESIYERYKYELFGLLSTLVTGEAKAMMNSLIEDGDESHACGFKILWLFKKRWNVYTFSTKLYAFVKVMTPAKVKNELEVVGALLRWEAEVLALDKRFGEIISDTMKIAIILSMLPKDLQDTLYEKGIVTEEC